MSIKHLNAIELLYGLLIFNIIGVMIGILPAFLTGLLAIYFKLHRTPTHIGVLTLAGYIFTLIIEKMFYGDVYAAYGLLGAACALCVSVAVLPKKNTPQNIDDAINTA